MRDLLYEIKYAWQRVVRGYDDRLYWDMPGYLDPIILAGLKNLRKNGSGYPGSLTKDEWDAILDEMIQTFQGTAESRERGMALFGKYYDYLWD